MIKYIKKGIKMKKKTLGAVIILALSTGCAKNTVYFGTNTNLAVDFDVTSRSANIGYKNSQFASIPPKEDGTSFSVLGQSDVDVSISDMVIDEVFATGLAAECAASKPIPADALTGADKTKYGTLLFASYFSVSLFDVNLGATNPFLGGSIGYKRATATVIPIKKNHLRSVYAKNSVNTLKHDATTQQNGTQTDGIRFKQDFATGEASLFMASKNAKILTNDTSSIGCRPTITPSLAVPAAPGT